MYWPIDFVNQMRQKNNIILRKRCTLDCLSYYRDLLSSSATTYKLWFRFRLKIWNVISGVGDFVHTCRHPWQGPPITIHGVSVGRLSPAWIPIQNFECTLVKNYVSLWFDAQKGIGSPSKKNGQDLHLNSARHFVSLSYISIPTF